VRDNFLTERTKALEEMGVRPSSAPSFTSKATPIPKQYGRQANHASTQDEGGAPTDTQPQDDNSDEEEEEDGDALTRVMRSYKATQNLNRFAGMMKTMTPTRNIHVHLDMAKVRALVSKLAQTESVALSDGGCDTTLLGDGWYITEYTGRSANIVSFDEFAARKAGLPIITGITKYQLPDRKGHILIQSYKSVYNKGSKTTLLSEFQLRDCGCIVNNTYKGHRGAVFKAGTQCIKTPDNDGMQSFIIPLHLCAALMTMNILMPNEHDLETLPIVDITSPGVWLPSKHNETNHGLSFGDPIFDTSRVAQNVAMNHERHLPQKSMPRRLTYGRTDRLQC
jgi:hypothetical protein